MPSTTQSSTSLPTDQASQLEADKQHTSSDGFSGVVLGGILAGIAVLLVFVLILGYCMRKHKRKRYRQRLLEKTSSPNLRGGSIKGITVRREVQTTTVPIKLDVLHLKNGRGG
jgi:di/tricarboxylate transporter